MAHNGHGWWPLIDEQGKVVRGIELTRFRYNTLQTLRYKLFARAAYITTESRKTILNMSMAMQKRAWMQGLWDQAKAFDLPAEFADSQPP